MVEPSDSNILVHLKFLLYYFEAVSGMHINYHKSEVMIISKENSEVMIVACDLEWHLGS